MQHRPLDKTHQPEITALFQAVFSASEGEEEGQRIGALASALASRIDDEEILCFGTWEKASLVGCIFFTRLGFRQAILAYLLGPVAVSTAHQGQGIGQALIRQGLDALKKRSVNLALTYGDPAFYSRVGFDPLSETLIRAPLPLSIPEGWLGQSLTSEPIPAVAERPTCVAELNASVYW